MNKNDNRSQGQNRDMPQAQTEPSFFLKRLQQTQHKRSKLASSGDSVSPDNLSRLNLLYESRDKKLCLLEDAQGHISLVRSDYLADSSRETQLRTKVKTQHNKPRGTI